MPFVRRSTRPNVAPRRFTAAASPAEDKKKKRGPKPVKIPAALRNLTLKKREAAQKIMDLEQEVYE